MKSATNLIVPIFVKVELFHVQGRVNFLTFFAKKKNKEGAAN
jgi:hypothetical protein